MSCPYGSFVLEGDRLVFLHKFLERAPGRGWTREQEHKEEEDCLIAGLEQEEQEELTVGGLWPYTQEEEEEDGFGNSGSSGKKSKVTARDRLELRLVWNYSNPACSSRTIGCAPIVHRETKSGTTVRIPLGLDALGLLPTAAPATQLMEVLKGAVGRQVGDIAAAVLAEFKSKATISRPGVHHFHPPGLGHAVTLVYSQAAGEGGLEQFRRSVHKSFLLPLDRPLFRCCSCYYRCYFSFCLSRRSNAVTFATHGSAGKLRNVHLGLEHGLRGEGVKVALVQGSYVYHHYMQVWGVGVRVGVAVGKQTVAPRPQDNFDDDGWGCAYRSLQTLVSWLRLQGYTETEVQYCPPTGLVLNLRLFSQHILLLLLLLHFLLFCLLLYHYYHLHCLQVPGHKDVQKCLVDIGDKETKFIGSKQWIGSTEVGSCYMILLLLPLLLLR